MEYYDVTRLLDKNYYDIVNKPVRSTRMKLELLDHFENAIDSIEQDIDSSSAGSIVANNEQGCRRSCSFTLINVDEKYTLDENNFFWFNRKFRLYLGLTDGKDTFWFTKGVFITSSASCDSVAHTVDISGVDKYAQLNGDLNVLQADEMDTIFEIGTKIEDVIRDILMLDIGNGFVLDPIEPIIDPDIAKQTLYRDYTLSAGGYFGDFLTEIMTCFGCDIFYDALGRLTVSRIFNDDIPYWYAFKSPAYRFNYNIHGYIAPSLSADLKGVNKIIVSTDNTECENAQYTAINHNPRSPLCYDKIGARTLPENGGIITIDAGDPAYGTTEKKCKDYAEYRILKETCVALKVHFNTIPLFHLNEGDVISITDNHFGLYEDGFIIQSITYPMDTGELTIEAANLKYLNTDIYIDSLYTEIVQEVEYRVSYNLNQGKGWVGTTFVNSQDETFTAATGYDETNHADEFDREGYEFTYWTDEDSNIYYPGQSYANPMHDIRLKANWKSTEGRDFKVSLTNASSISYTPTSLSTITADDVSSVTIAGDKYYKVGRGYDFGDANIQFPEPYSGTFDYIERSTGGTNSWDSMFAIIRLLGVSAIESIEFPDYLNSVGAYYSSSDIENGTCKRIKFPKMATTITTHDNSGYETTRDYYYQSNNIEILDFNNRQTVTVSAKVSESSTARYFVSDCGNLKEVIFRSGLAITNTGNYGTTGTTGILANYYAFLNLKANIYIKGDLYVRKAVVFSQSTISSDEENAFIVGSRLYMYDNYSAFCFNLDSPNTRIELGNISSYAGKALINSTLKSVKVTGTISISSGSRNGLLSALTVSEPIIINNITINAGDVLSNNSVEEIVIKGNLTHNVAAANTLCSNTNLKTIRIYKTVRFGTSATSSFVCGNTNLTDIYFYSDNFASTTPSYDDNAFIGNNANLTFHGIAGGAVETYATAHGITFVELTQEEIEEVQNA